MEFGTTGILAPQWTTWKCAKRTPRFPRGLSETDVEALLAAPDVNTDLGLRDRAMLETLYATGLRVSELVALKVFEVDLNANVVRALGKGSKQRLVPLGEVAVRGYDHPMSVWQLG